MKKIAVLLGIIFLVAIYLVYSGLRSKNAQPGKTSKSADFSATQNQQVGDREPQAVEIPPDKQQLIGVKTSEVKILPLKKTLRTVGRVEFDERKLTTVNVKVEGWVEKLYADYTGKYVKKGEPLAEIYSPELMSTQLEFINLLKWRRDQAHRFQRNVEFEWGDRYGTTAKVLSYDLEAVIQVAKQKLALWEIPEADIKKLEEEREPLKTMTVRAPSSGYVFQKPAFKGTRVAPGDKIFDVVDLSSVWIIADIYEYEIPFVKMGQKARITLSYFPEKEFISKVDFIYPSLSGQTRTARARFIIPNPSMILKPQMFANVEMELDLGERLAIPATAVLDTGTRQVVYVDMGDGYFMPRQVKLGDRADGMVEVTSGLKAGEKVASMAVFLIDSEAKLKGLSQ
jgi:membrane fusion protein, copper/silver efflux system